ncbi:nucleotide exchange factor GrpE [Candidatus Pelagibacter sp. HIMB1587]|uniref:nucleotide exchange factor GrpE n=1 Tax=Candidatus Pelagibacter sp. HIMB1587 TaxID=3413354 RepID=UPI003F874439
MNTTILISVLVFIVIILIVQLWFANKNRNENFDLSEDINQEIESLDKELKEIKEQISSNNNLLETYNKVISNKSEELESYKEANTNTKQKGLFTSLIGIIDFIEKFNLDNNHLDEKTKNYLIAIQDKLEIAISSTGIEKFEPNLNDNIMEVTGCTPSRKTQKTNDASKVNLISRVLKPGYRILIKDDKFNYIKNAEVEIFELDHK